jgi:four helix bundle protein
MDHARNDGLLLAAHVDQKTVSQLSRAIASIGANIAEGYSRRSGADRSRFYGYALGSTREAMVWYRSVAWCLPEATMELRMAFLTQERRLIIGMLKSVQRLGGPSFEPG